MKYADLPEKLRRQVDAAGEKPKGRAKRGGSVAFRGWCVGCGAFLTSGAALERHRDEKGPGHSRFQVLPEPRVLP